MELQEIKSRINACMYHDGDGHSIASRIFEESRPSELLEIIGYLIDKYKEAPDLLRKFWETFESDSCPLESTEAERQQVNFSRYVRYQIQNR